MELNICMHLKHHVVSAQGAETQTDGVSAAAHRQKTVSGWVPVGGPFGGSAATPWLTMLAGDDDALLQVHVQSLS
jgi:hypothetical protein